MPLTKKEQKVFEGMFDDLIPYHDIPTDNDFLKNLGDLIFEMTGNVSLNMKIFNISERLSSA